ncbi:ATP-binding protein [Paenibacillus amylolyticus]|uniref:ATP-binding protein n=1 Tax=Paenibacillus amylolyticus TaxID=1451 RepID=UPI0009FB24BE|nr:ATP-binding protein [Paenibacillus amylolyticus]
MQSLKDELKKLDLEAIRRRANSHSSTSVADAVEPKQYRCKHCKDELGWIKRVKLSDKPFDYSDNWEDCPCTKDRAIERLMKSSQITEKFRQKTLSNFTTAGRPELVKESHQAAVEYAEAYTAIKDTPQNSMALLGKSGAGKTHLLMGVSNNLLKKGVGVLYFPYIEGFSELKDNLNTVGTRLQQLKQVEVLFIDDLFKGGKKDPHTGIKMPSDWEVEKMIEVINHRYLEQKPTLVSSERDIADLCDIDEALGGRIHEMCKDYMVIITGGLEMNYRLQ